MTAEIVAKPKRRRGVSPTARSLAFARSKGWTIQVVEKWQAIPDHPAGGVRIDLFGCIDLVACTPAIGTRAGRIIGIQATSRANRSARMNKILTDPIVAPRARAWCEAGGLLEVWAWAKMKASKKWELTRERAIFPQRG